MDEIRGFISGTLLEVAEMFEKKITVLSRTRFSPEWFDNEYKEGRKLVRRSLRRFKRDSSDENRKHYVDNRNKHNLIINQKKPWAKKKKLHNMANNLQNSEAFWIEMRASSTRPFAVKTNIDHEQWFEVLRCIVSCCSTSFPWLVFLFGALL